MKFYLASSWSNKEQVFGLNKPKRADIFQPLVDWQESLEDILDKIDIGG